MRKTILLILSVFVMLPALSQRRADFGATAGMVNYFGEDKNVSIFSAPGPAGQFFYRYNFNPRQALRANLLGGYLRSDQEFNGLLGELGVTYEFNFFSYSTLRSRIVDYTPYIAAGAAVSVVNSSAFFVFPSIPFSAGFKVNVANNIGIELEYGFRKTFIDKFDGQTNLDDLGAQTWTHNNDWYSFMGVAVTWKLYNKLAGCPAFAEMEKEKKRKK